MKLGTLSFSRRGGGRISRYASGLNGEKPQKLDFNADRSTAY